MKTTYPEKNLPGKEHIRKITYPEKNISGK
jgi:hypothetical protein